MARLENLRVYNAARDACADAYRAAGAVRDRSLRDQIRRAATSVVLNIAEGSARSDADFARYLVIARGSNNELAAQLGFAARLGLADRQQAAHLCDRIASTGRMLSALITRLRSG